MWCHAHDPEEWIQREPQLAPVSYWQPAFVAVGERDQTDPLAPPGRVFARKCASAVAVADHAVIDSTLQRKHLDLQHVTGQGAGYGDRTGDHVWAMAVRIADAVGGCQFDGFGQDLARFDAVRREERARIATLVLQDAFVAHRIDTDRLA